MIKGLWGVYVGLVVVLVGCQKRTLAPSITGTGPKPPKKVSLSPVQQAVIDVHNEKRHHYFTDADLHYSLALESVAQVYANHLASLGRFEHDPTNHQRGLGENLFAHTQHYPVTIEEAMLQWYDAERPLYHYANASCDKKKDAKGREIGCGHYTQIIWKKTREVGCANAQYQTGIFKGGYVYVCKYKDAGNVIFNGVPQKPY